MDGRPWGRCESVPGQNSAYRPLSRDFQDVRRDRIYRIYDRRTLILVFAPDRPRRAGVAHGTSLVHGAEGQRVFRATEKAVDLDRGGMSRHDADVADRAAADAT